MTKTEKLQSQLKQVQAIVNSFPLPSKTLELWTKQAWLTNKQTNISFIMGISGDSLHVYRDPSRKRCLFNDSLREIA